MLEKNSKVKKFDIVFECYYGKNNEYSRYKIVGLDRAFYDKDDDYSFANGACGLLKQNNIQDIVNFVLYFILKILKTLVTKDTL